MSLKKSNLKFAIAITVLLVIAGALTVLALQKAYSSADREYEKIAWQLIGEVKPNLERVRGLSLTKKFGLEIVTEDWVLKKWGTEYYQSISRYVEIEERIYKSLFLIPANYSLQEIYSKVSGFAAAYDGTNLLIVKEYFNPKAPSAREIIAHELFHVIQSEHFKAPETRTFDEKQAWATLIEGDSGLTVKAYVETTRPQPLVRNGLIATPASLLLAREGLDPIYQLRGFPYDYGDKFVAELYRRGGWELVNNAYLKPPTTTEQVMNVSKYLSGEGGMEVPPLALKSPGWTLERTDTMGEHFIFVTLRNHISESQARLASEGWGGDKLTYYEKGEDRLLIWRIDWDSVKDASEFYAASLELLGRVNALTFQGADGLPLWKVEWGYIAISLKGSSTIVICSTDGEAIKQVSP